MELGRTVQTLREVLRDSASGRILLEEARSVILRAMHTLDVIQVLSIQAKVFTSSEMTAMEGSALREDQGPGMSAVELLGKGRELQQRLGGKKVEVMEEIMHSMEKRDL